MGKPTTDRAHPQASKAPPQDQKQFAKLVALLKEYPGQTAIQLQHLGWRPETDDDLREAERAGLIVWVRNRWYAV